VGPVETPVLVRTGKGSDWGNHSQITNAARQKENYIMTTNAIQNTAAEPTFVPTADEIDQALEVQREHDLLLVAHPLKADRALHHVGECDGACLQFRCFRV